MKITSITECQNQIDTMRQLLKEFERQAQIQFPIYDGPDDRKQFRHYAVNHIQHLLPAIRERVDELQEELDRYQEALKY